MSPISKLPPEIISTIFYFLSREYDSISVLPCYNFTHVSRLWRHIALNTPNLWHVLPMDLPWATTFLERSKAMDLVIRQSLAGFSRVPAWVSFLKHVLETHTSRIRHLTFFENDPPYLASIFESARPFSLRPHSLKLSGRNFTFPSGIMDTSNLQTLNVYHCDGPWYSLSYPALTSLTLIDIPNPPCLPKFLDVLRALRSLTYLKTELSFPLADNPISGSREPVSLPNLHYLYLSSTADPRDVSNVLSSIIVPQTAILHILVNVEDSMDVFLEEFTPSLWKSADHGTFYSNLEISDEYPLEIIAWKDHGCAPGEPDLTLELELEPWGPAPLNQDILQKIFCLSLPFFNITTLTLLLDIDPLDSLMQDTLGCLPYLQTINLDCSHIDDFIDALAYKPENYNIEASAYYSVKFPSLRSLSIRHFSFQVDTTEVEELVDCLIERCERGAGLWNLKFAYCDNLHTTELERLQEIVVDVEWIHW